MINLTQV